MSNYSALKTDINNNIYENNTQQITGTVLNTVLKDMVNTLGAGYQFAGCAYLDLNPGAPDAKVFYLAGEGLYTNFDNIQVPAGKLGILKWDTRWHLETIEGLGGGGANLTGYISVASTDDLPDVGQPTLGYLCGTNLYLYVGEGGDTKEGKYQDCGGFRGPEGVGITEIEQVEQSTANGGRNTIRIHLSDGHSYDVYTRNGTTSTGLFPTLAALQSAYPSPVVGQYAFVGAGFPADIYVCNTAGTWTDSGADYDGDSVDLTDYATKAELNQLEAKVTDIEDAIPQSENYLPLEQGTIDSSGNNADSDERVRTIDYIPVASQPTISCNPDKSIGKRFYDSNKSYLGTSYTSSAAFLRLIIVSPTFTGTITIVENNVETEYETQKYKECASKKETEQINGQISTINGQISTINGKVTANTESIERAITLLLNTNDKNGTLSPNDGRVTISRFFPISEPPIISSTAGDVYIRYYDTSFNFLASSYSSSAKYIRIVVVVSEGVAISDSSLLGKTITINGVVYDFHKGLLEISNAFLREVSDVSLLRNRMQYADLIQVFPKVTTVGDSLMAGFTSVDGTVIGSATAKGLKNNWVGYLEKRTGQAYTNLAIGSSTTHHWRYADGPSAGNIADIEEADIQTDCYLLGLGVNDKSVGMAVGTISDVAENMRNNADTFFGNYDYLLRKMASFNPKAHIFCFTMPSSQSGAESYNDAIKTLCARYSSKAHCIDLTEYSEFSSGLIPDNLYNGHYNPIAYNVISVIIQGAIGKYIFEHNSLFIIVPYN